MIELRLFTDGSVNVQTKVGYGAYLTAFDGEVSPDALRSRVKVKRFEHTASTKLELQTLLWALNEILPFDGKVMVYTDSQNIMTLKARRGRYERSAYHSKRNRRINHYLLYQEFYSAMDRLNCSFVKVRGHLPLNQKNPADQLFSLVDRASREALRADISVEHLSNQQLPRD